MTRDEYNAQRTELLVKRLNTTTPRAFDRVQFHITTMDQWAPAFAADPFGIRALLDDEDDAEEVAA